MCREDIERALEVQIVNAETGERNEGRFGYYYDRNTEREGPPYVIIDDAEPSLGETGRLLRSRYEVLIVSRPDDAHDDYIAATNALLDDALVLLVEATPPAVRDIFGGDVDQGDGDAIPSAITTFVVECP